MVTVASLRQNTGDPVNDELDTPEAPRRFTEKLALGQTME
jgi:hypothetical protein